MNINCMFLLKKHKWKFITNEFYGKYKAYKCDFCNALKLRVNKNE